MTNHFILFLVLLCATLVACKAPEKVSDSSGSTSKERPPASSSEGFEADLVRLRKTVWLEKPGCHASSVEAVQAAQRIFANITFVGMRRGQILQILGDPRTISDYGVPMGEKSNSPLLYRFDTGFGGVEYAILFNRGRAIKVESRGID